MFNYHYNVIVCSIRAANIRPASGGDDGGISAVSVMLVHVTVHGGNNSILLSRVNNRLETVSNFAIPIAMVLIYCYGLDQLLWS